MTISYREHQAIKHLARAQAVSARWSPGTDNGPTVTGEFEGFSRQQAVRQFDRIHNGLKNSCRADPGRIILEKSIDSDFPILRIVGFATKTSVLMEMIREEHERDAGKDYLIRLNIASESWQREKSE